MGRKKQEDIGMYALVVNSDQEVLSPTESVKSEYDANFDMMSLTDTQVFVVQFFCFVFLGLIDIRSVGSFNVVVYSNSLTL